MPESSRDRLTTKKALLALRGIEIRIVDGQGRLIFSNREPETDVGRPYLEVMHGARKFDGGGRYTSRLIETLETGRELVDEIIVRPSNRVHRVNTTRLTDDSGQVLGAVSLTVDVTEEHALRERLRRAEWLSVIGELAAVTAHELRNPLTAIRATAQLGCMLSEVQKKDDALLRIMAEIDRLNEFVGDLLLLTCDDGKEVAPVALRDVVDDALAMVQGKALLHRIEIARRLAPDLPILSANRQLLRHAILHLLVNAIQAMPDGGTLTVTAGANCDAVHLTVEDTGKGMSPEILSRLFTPFSTTRAGRSGLGLAVSHQIIVDYHGGDIQVHSELGKGTTVRVQLPLAPARPCPSFFAPRASSPLETADDLTTAGEEKKKNAVRLQRQRRSGL